MTIQIGLSILFMAFIAALVYKFKDNGKKLPLTGVLVMLFAAGLALRLLLAYFTIGFANDIALFKAWGQLCNDIGYGGVYFQNELFLDYPPGYLYILSWLDGIRGLLNLPMESDGYTLMVKLPSILADLATAFIIYRLGAKKLSLGWGVLLSAAYMFCPAVLINSSVWGQIDSLCALIMVASLFLLDKNRIIPSAIVYGIAVVFKPQMLIFAPIFIFYTIIRKRYLQLAVGIGCSLLAIMLVATPFVKNFDYLFLIEKYKSTMDYYSYYTVNAYNIWALIGQNWGALPENPIALFALNWSVPAIATALCGIYMWKHRENYSIFMALAILMSTVFMFAVKMHERYLFPALIALLISYMLSKDKRQLLLFGGFATVHFLNTSYILYLDNSYVAPFAPQVLLLSAAQLGMFIYLIYVAFTPKRAVAGEFNIKYADKITQAVAAKLPAAAPEEPVDRAMHAKDWFLALGLAGIYAIFAFWSLGSNVSANTSWEPGQGESVVLKAGGEYNSISFLSGIGRREQSYYRVGCNFSLELSADGINWQPLGDLLVTENSWNEVYAWKERTVENPLPYLKITALDGESILNEIAFETVDGQGFTPIELIEGNGQMLIDEQNTVPNTPSYYNSTYFDEIYHARTAYEHLLGVDAYENTHPTLGKLIITASISVFGMNPFGWRFAGALFGVLMLPIFYHILKRLFGKSSLAAAGLILFAFDFMHFTQTRIATIDTYAVFFILLMYDAMLVFIQKDFMKSSIKSLLVPLLLSGIFMGMGAAAKWTCIYGAVGLAVLLFAKFITSYRGAKDKSACMKRITELCLWCVLFFITIPFAIYFAAFLPLTTLPHNVNNIFGSFVGYQTHMFSYHSGLVAEHYFASPWYEWPLDLRDIWYVNTSLNSATGEISSIACLGNPLLWWCGLVGLVAAIGFFVKERRQALGFLLTGFGAVYLPWVLVPRLTFVYHYFTAVPFIIMALMYCIKRMSAVGLWARPVGKLKITWSVVLLWGFVAVNLGMFALFYPVISGAPTTADFANALEWLPGWTFA